MQRILWMPRIVALGTLWLVALVPGGTFGQTPHATVVRVEGATKTFQVQDRDGRMVEVELPAQSLVDIRTSPGGQMSARGATTSAAGTIPAQVVAVDTVTNTVKVQTQAGQIVELAMPTKDLQIGEPLTLVIPK